MRPFPSFAFVNSTVWRAFKSRVDLSLSDFPDQRAVEKSSVLRSRYLAAFDPLSSTAHPSIARTILRLWWKDVLALELLVVFGTVFSFSEVLGLQRLLNYVERPDDALVFPWVWIALLGMGPLVKSAAYSLFTYWSSRCASVPYETRVSSGAV